MVRPISNRPERQLCREDIELRVIDVLAPQADLVRRYVSVGNKTGLLDDLISIASECDKGSRAYESSVWMIGKYAGELREALAGLRKATLNGEPMFVQECKDGVHALEQCAKWLEQRGATHLAKEVWAGEKDTLHPSRSSLLVI